MVSVIIPNLNKARFIEETIKSVLIQLYKKIEVIVVDDGSTDESVSICQSIAQVDTRIRVYVRDSLGSGASYCRNLGLQYAKGDYILFLDSDDIITQNCIESRLKVFETYNDLSFIVFPTGTFYKVVGDSSSCWIPPKASDYLLKFLSHDLPWNISAPLWKKEFLIRLGGFDSSYERLQDVELHSRALMRKDVSFKVIPEHTIDFYYRIDLNRLLHPYPVFLENFVNSILHYVQKMLVHIKQLPPISQYACSKALRGSVFTGITTILHYFKSGRITSDEKEKLIKKLLSDDGISKSVYSNFALILLEVYIKGYERGLYKIKGFNFLYKKIILNC